MRNGAALLLLFGEVLFDGGSDNIKLKFICSVDTCLYVKLTGRLMWQKHVSHYFKENLDNADLLIDDEGSSSAFLMNSDINFLSTMTGLAIKFIGVLILYSQWRHIIHFQKNPILIGKASFKSSSNFFFHIKPLNKHKLSNFTNTYCSYKKSKIHENKTIK